MWRSVGPQGHFSSSCTAEHRAGVPASCEPVNNGLDLRGDGNSSISSGIGLGAADKCILLPIIIAYIQLQQFGRPEAEIALGEHIVRVGHYAYILSQFVQLLDGDPILAAALASPHNEILLPICPSINLCTPKPPRNNVTRTLARGDIDDSLLKFYKMHKLYFGKFTQYNSRFVQNTKNARIGC